MLEPTADHRWRHTHMGNLMSRSLDRFDARVLTLMSRNEAVPLSLSNLAARGQLTAAHVQITRHLPVEGTRLTDLAARAGVTKQAMGKLVVATDHGGARETIIQNETGYLVPKNQPKIMAEAIEYALRMDPETAKVMGEYGKQHVRANYTSAQMQERTMAVYRELLARH